MNTNSKAFMEILRERRSAKHVDENKPLSLTEEIQAWLTSLPQEEKTMGFSMDFLHKTFGRSPAAIGVALFWLGFTRRRSWKPNKPHSRIWYAPQKKNGDTI